MIEWKASLPGYNWPCIVCHLANGMQYPVVCDVAIPQACDWSAQTNHVRAACSHQKWLVPSGMPPEAIWLSETSQTSGDALAHTYFWKSRLRGAPRYKRAKRLPHHDSIFQWRVSFCILCRRHILCTLSPIMFIWISLLWFISSFFMKYSRF